MVPVEDVVSLALAQTGDEYVFGAQSPISDPDPDVFDCSELVRWVCGRLGVKPTMVDGSWLQYRHCAAHQRAISVPEGIAERGALLFRFSSSPLVGGRPSSAHVAISLGDGRTIEARGRSWGVGSWTAHNRGWTHAALIPGVDYAPESEEDLAILTTDEQRLLKAFLKEIELKESNVGFVKHAIQLVRDHRPGEIHYIPQSVLPRLAQVEAELAALAAGGFDPADFEIIIRRKEV
jgi:hypothetical protein